MDHDEKSTSSSSNAHEAIGRTVSSDVENWLADNLSSSPHSMASLLYDDRETTYSYFSTWSTNYTESNLAGPGRILGNIFSRAGSSLERRLGKLAYRVKLGTYAKAEGHLVEFRLNEMFSAENGSKRRRGWKLLMGYLRSTNPSIQLMAFDYLIHNAILIPAFRLDALRQFQQRGRRNDPLFDEAAFLTTTQFSWKRPGVRYSALWLYYYNLSLRCISDETGSDSVMDALSRIDHLRGGDVKLLEFERFEEALCCCRDVLDTTLVVEYCSSWWDCEGLDAYVRKKGFSDPLLRDFVAALRLRYEVELEPLVDNASMGEDPSWRTESTVKGLAVVSHLPYLAMIFVDALWAALRTALLTGSVSSPSPNGDDGVSSMKLWIEVFKLHCVSQSRAGKMLNRGLPNSHPTFCKKSWREVCFAELPSFIVGPTNLDDYFGEMRRRLLELEVIHGEAYRRWYPPVEDSG